jgi:outer membrane protein OmpA-like peptidoglycan-associated protein
MSAMKIIKTICCMVFSYSFFILPVQAFERDEDVTEAMDSSLFQRYAQSKIVGYQRLDTLDYLLALDAPKTVNGVMTLDYSERLTGDLTRITYRAPDDYSSKEMFKHFTSQLNQWPHKVLFECHARECGDSSQWANQILNIRELYGPDGYQHYLAAQIEAQQGSVFVVLYSVKRGNKRVYTQLDVLQPTAGSFRQLSVNPKTILAQLLQQGVVTLPTLEFDDKDKLTSDTGASLASVIAALQKNTRLKLYVVGHLREKQTLDVLQQRSLTQAQSVVELLVKKGINSERLSAQGVGPLAPIEKFSSDRRITLVAQ